MAASKGKTNWWLVIGGAVLVLCGVSIYAAPGFFLEFLTVWAGIGFLVSGVAGAVSYLQMRRLAPVSGWNLAMAVLDLLVGVMLIVHPLAFAGVIPWILGVAFIVIGVVEVVGMMPFARLVPESRIIAIISGVLSILIGAMFVIWPASLSLWVAAFALVRGITLIVMGFTVRS